ncbi:hypothetical protein C6P46_000482 [Rhodotorula mucilaginosa]|uniref:PLC-like phosphodiesterase n=1 Tax=Rhodotorula mucilaginosa TaxID=5537 RepID=A0A9P6VVB2_RHOMI|nr:hypothetical protein C6P46_000482 [Rhodotorula mucilaginosa]
MAALPDHVHLDTLYLPGTHTTTLTAQLRGGIRCLDLRFSLIRDDKKGGKPLLWAYHGPVPQGREMGEVFQELYEWLGSEEGKRETVIVSIKQENTGGHEFAALVWELIDSTRPYMWYDQNAWPTLGQVRGRCVMFCRFGFESGRGLHPPIWPNDKPYPWRTEIGGRATVVQDWYGVRSPLSIPDKANLALSLFDSSSAAFSHSPTPEEDSTSATASAGMPRKVDNEPPTVPFRINFLSCGTFPTLYPSHAAKGFGAPRFGIGYRGVNRLVLLGLERLDDAAPAAARATSRGDVQHVVVRAEDLQDALPPPPPVGPEEEEKPPTTGGGDFAGETLDRPQLAGGRQRREGQGGMMVFMDFWESPHPRKDSLVDRIIEMNF